MSKKKSIKRGLYQVVLIDDNVNTFDHVTNCLIEICGHNYLQAVQSSLITHNVKQCSIFVDSYDLCVDICDELVAEGLNAIVTKYKKL